MMSGNPATVTKVRHSDSDFQIGDIVRFKQTWIGWDVWKVIGRCFGDRSYVISTFESDEPVYILEHVAPEFLEMVEAP
jgi:hypothetical protein